MGMFDEIICEYPLPDLPKPEIQKMLFQTKNLENCLFNYKITQEGELWREDIEQEIVPEEQRPYYGKPEWNKSRLYQLIGAYKIITCGSTKIDFDGEIYFYTDLQTNNKPLGWIEYCAKFKDGKLINIELVKYREGK